MADIQKGVTFVDGTSEIHAVDLHNIADLATLADGCIIDRDAFTAPVTGDKFLIYDSVGPGLKKIDYNDLKTKINASAAVTKIEQSITQAAHPFSVGHVVMASRAEDGTYQLGTNLHATGNFTVTSLPADECTFASHPLESGDPVYFSSTGTLPAPLEPGKVYYAKDISTNVFTIYQEVGLTNLIDLTDTGTGTHSVHYGLGNDHGFGICSEDTNSNTFKVVYSGEITGLSGLVGGRVYYVGAAGATVDDPDTNTIGTYVVPIMIATSTTTALVIPNADTPLRAMAVTTESVADGAIERAKLSSSVRQSIDRNIGLDRQMVLTGGVDANGNSDYLAPGTADAVDLDATTDPFIVSFANGFNETEGYNFVERLDTSVSFSGLGTSEEKFLYIDRDSAGTLTYNNTGISPVYGNAPKSEFRTRAVTPLMTSDTTPSGWTVTSSSGTDPYQVFDGDRRATAQWASTFAGVGWVQIELPYPKAINRMEIQIDTIGKAPIAFTLQGSNTDTWPGTTVISPSTPTWTTTGETQVFTKTNEITRYKYWRLDITATQSSGVPTIRNLVLCESVEHYYDISLGEMYSFDGAGTWTKRNRVFVGEVRTSGVPDVSAADVYSYQARGKYVIPVTKYDTNGTSNTYSTLTHSIGTELWNADVWYRESGQFPWWRLSGEVGDGGDTNSGIKILPATDTSGSFNDDAREERLQCTVWKRAHGVDGNRDPLLVSHRDTTPQEGEYYAILKRNF